MNKLYDTLVTSFPTKSGSAAPSSTPMDVLIDDRPHPTTAGWKFRDAELIGYPVMIVLGRAWKRGEGRVEVQARRLGVKREVAWDEVVGVVKELLGRM